MKYLLLLPFAMLLQSCGLFEAFQQAASDPTVIEPLIKIVEQLPETVASGDWTSTEVGATSAISALVIGALTKWLHGRMKKSSPGAIIG